MFGRGRFQNGVLIDPKPQFAFDPKDDAKLENFRILIWQVSVYSVSLILTTKSRPTVERLNAYAPQHSRLFKEACASIQIRDDMLIKTNCADDNYCVSVQAVCLYCEDDGAQASHPQGL